MTDPWPDDEPGLLVLPSGRRVRGRSAKRDPVNQAEWQLRLGPRAVRLPVPGRAVRWPDFWIPADPDDALAAIAELWRRSADQRVEVCCGGGVGRTGTALAALLLIEDMSPTEAVRTVRSGYHPRAVETPWQRTWLTRVAPRLARVG